PFDLVLPAAARGQDQNGVVQAGLAQIRDDVQTRGAGQADVYDGDVDGIFHGEEQSFLALAGTVDGKAIVAQLLADLLPQIGVVFNYQRTHNDIPGSMAVIRVR